MIELDVYTDGACRGNPGIGGWAGVAVSGTGPIMTVSGCEHKTTNQRMEILAAIKILTLIPKDIRVIVYSDSAYLCNCINAKWYEKWLTNGWVNSANKPVANDDLWKDLLTQLSDREYSFKWVKGHASNKYNNMCDKMANKIIDLHNGGK